MNNFEKPIWEKIPGSYDLKVKNPENLDFNKFKELLEKVKLPTPDLKINFSKLATKLVNEWLDNRAEKPFAEAAYCLLSNWPLSGRKAASESSRSVVIWQLWDELFCVRPERRLTNWKISGSKVIPDEFNFWWQKQKGCQTME